MPGNRYTEEFKAEVVRHVIDRSHPMADVAARLGISCDVVNQVRCLRAGQAALRACLLGARVYCANVTLAVVEFAPARTRTR